MEKKTFAVPGRREPVDVLMLSPRECDVLRLVVRGWSSKDIAASLEIAGDTVRSYISDMSRIVGASNRGELMVWALKNVGALSGGVIMQEHPVDCACQSPYCMAMADPAGGGELVDPALRVHMETTYHDRVNDARRQYDQIKRIPETTSGDLTAALERYAAALDAFADIVLRRKLPRDWPAS